MANFTKQTQPQSFVAFFIKESIHEFSKTWNGAIKHFKTEFTKTEYQTLTWVLFKCKFKRKIEF